MVSLVFEFTEPRVQMSTKICINLKFVRKLLHHTMAACDDVDLILTPSSAVKREMCPLSCSMFTHCTCRASPLHLISYNLNPPSWGPSSAPGQEPQSAFTQSATGLLSASPQVNTPGVAAAWKRTQQFCVLCQAGYTVAVVSGWQDYTRERAVSGFT